MSVARNVLALAAVAAVAVFAGGCSPESCSLSPALSTAPTSCTLRANTEVTVGVRWCQCESVARCDVQFDGNAFFLRPVIDSCDASCPDNPESCSFPISECTFTAPGLTTNNDYGVTVADGFGTSGTPRTFTISGSGSTSCGL